MELHCGERMTVSIERLVMILNARGMSPETAAMIRQAKQERRYTACSGTPKSYLLLRDPEGKETVRESILAPATLLKRWRESCLQVRLEELAVYSVTALPGQD